MFRRRPVLTLTLFYAAACQAAPQAEGHAATPTTNPYAGDEAAITQGRSTFRARCSSCHGEDGNGGRAPELTSGHFASGDRDSDVYRAISAGVPNSEMPAWSTRLKPDEIWRVVAFLRASQRPG